jgi:flagellar biogenesis protein FliO
MEILGIDYEAGKQMKLLQKFIQRRFWLFKVLKLTIFTYWLIKKLLKYLSKASNYQHTSLYASAENDFLLSP